MRDTARQSAPAVPAAASDVLLSLAGAGLTTLLLSLALPPWSHYTWPLALVGLAPWAYAVCRTQRAWAVYWSSHLLGFAFFLVNLAWLMPVTGLGFVALAAYLAIYWPLAAWAIRTAQRFGVSVVWSLPIVWVACEYLRAWVMSGFPWLFISHSFYLQPALIQISDLVGAYGVTFLAAMVSGVVAQQMLLLRTGTGRFRAQWRLGVLVTCLLWVGNVLYGYYRWTQARGLVDGPRVAVVQHDFVQRTEPPLVPSEAVFAAYITLGAQAAGERPDLIVFPETASGGIQNLEFINTPLHAVDESDAGAYARGLRMHKATSALARGDYAPINEVLSEWEALFRRIAPHNPDYELPERLPRLSAEGGPPATVVIGALALETSAGEAYPKSKRFNSALVYDPNGSQRPARYDKNHLVPFGEFVPFRQQRFLGLDLHPLYRWLNSLSPFSQGGKIEYSLWAGRELTVFEVECGGGRYRFGTPICYEGAMPYVIRDYVWGGGERRVDFLLNISNDGWFLHSSELPQHLAAYVFRAVENRVAIARSVNTGISGFVTPNGEIHDLVADNGRTIGPGVVGYRIARVKLDPRASLYGRTGDWFARACLTLAGVAWAGAVISRWVLGLRNRIARWRRATRSEHETTH